MAPTLAAPDVVTAALEKEFEGVTPERKNAILATVRACPPGNRAELHKIFSKGGLNDKELAFYQLIIVLPPDPAAAGPQSEPQVAAPSPETAVTAAPEGAAAANSKAAASRAR